MLQARLLQKSDQTTINTRRECLLMGYSLLEAVKAARWNDAITFAGVLREHGVLSTRMDIALASAYTGVGRFDDAWSIVQSWFSMQHDDDCLFRFERQRIIDCAVRITLSFPRDLMRDEIAEVIRQAEKWNVSTDVQSAKWLDRLRLHIGS